MKHLSLCSFRMPQKLFIVFFLLCFNSKSIAQSDSKLSSNFAGWKQWIGIDSDWNQNYNWNGGIPTITDSAIISRLNFSGSYHPVITSNVSANVYKLRIENDTLELNAAIASSLTVKDSFSINNNAVVKIATDSVMLSNGLNTNTTFLPFRGSFREQKMQLMYKTSEFLAMGVHNGDVIEKIIFPVRIRRSTIPFSVNINMYYATNNASYPNFSTTGFIAPVPAAPINCLAPQATVPVNVYSGNIDLTSIPLNGSGYFTITLSTPFTFLNNPATPLIIEICYSLPVASVNNDSWQTQTVGYRSVLLLSNLSTYVPSACSWNNTAPNGISLTQKLADNLRPNLGFVFQTPYSNFPITVGGNWKNDGHFAAGKSTVTFNGTILQKISGTNTNSFYDLSIDNASGVKLFSSVSVADVLNLQHGKLNLNANILSIQNPATGAIVRTSGKIQSESTPPNYGIIEWNIGSRSGAHVFPFSTGAGTYIPLVYNLTLGDVGTVRAATYHTSANNLPLPTGVTNVNDTSNLDNSTYTVDRFWYLNKTGPSGKVKINFTYLNSEAPAPITNGNIEVQRYISSNNKWKILPLQMTNTLNTPSLLTSQLLVYAVTGNNLVANVWALADAASPLRLEPSIYNEIEVNPNPFTDKINISLNNFSEKNENIVLSLYSMLGVKVDEIIVPAHSVLSDGHLEWIPDNIKKGIYLLVAQTKSRIWTNKLMKLSE